jgi:long-chain fatty acid transport protein
VPGGISYGFQRDNSEIVVLRTAAGAGVSLGPQWSFGANVGLDYNQNTLEAPYIFQSAPGLVGDKVLVDLHTSGFGVNAQTGVLFRPRQDLQFGLTYESPTTIFSHGDASGNAGAQLKVPSYPFHYDAYVKNVLPQIVTGGASWKFHEDWRMALQVDWINWAGAFTQLPVSLSDGHTALPASIKDTVPLDWQNELVFRGGLEYFATKNLVLRGGYCYGNDPVPDETLTPLTAAIIESTLTAGVGYYWGRYKIDLGYQWGIPETRNIGVSALQAQEYSQSSIRVGSQTFVLTCGIRF